MSEQTRSITFLLKGENMKTRVDTYDLKCDNVDCGKEQFVKEKKMLKDGLQHMFEVIEI